MICRSRRESVFGFGFSLMCYFSSIPAKKIAADVLRVKIIFAPTIWSLPLASIAVRRRASASLATAAHPLVTQAMHDA